MRLHLALLVVVGVLGLQTAFADTFSISADNLAGAICSSANPCGTVSVTGTGTLTVNIALNPATYKAASPILIAH